MNTSNDPKSDEAILLVNGRIKVNLAGFGRIKMELIIIAFFAHFKELMQNFCFHPLVNFKRYITECLYLPWEGTTTKRMGSILIFSTTYHAASRIFLFLRGTRVGNISWHARHAKILIFNGILIFHSHSHSLAAWEEWLGAGFFIPSSQRESYKCYKPRKPHFSYNAKPTCLRFLSRKIDSENSLPVISTNISSIKEIFHLCCSWIIKSLTSISIGKLPREIKSTAPSSGRKIIEVY